MHVIRHDTPCDEPVALPVEEQQCVLDDACCTWISKDTRSVAGIFIAIDLAAELDHSWIVRGGVAVDDELAPPFVDYVLRECVGESKRDGLN